MLTMKFNFGFSENDPGQHFTTGGTCLNQCFLLRISLFPVTWIWNFRQTIIKSKPR